MKIVILANDNVAYSGILSYPILKNFSNINGSANCMILPVFFIFDFEVIVNYIVIKIPNVGVIRFYSG